MNTKSLFLVLFLGCSLFHAPNNAAEKKHVIEKQLTEAKMKVDSIIHLLDKASDDKKAELTNQLAVAHKEWDAERLKYLESEGYL